MNKSIVTTLILVLLTATAAAAWNVCLHGAPSGIADTGGGQNFEDDFTSDPTSTWITQSGTTPTHNSGTVEFTEDASFLYPTQTDTISQWGIVEVDDHGSVMHAAHYFRSPNNASLYSYALRVDVGTTIIWRECTGHSCTNIESWSRGVTNGDFIGYTVQGTGDSTVVDVYDFGTSTPNSCASASACNPDALDWDTYDEAKTQMTNNPTNAADTGKYIGLYSGSTADAQFDNWFGGDWTP